MKEYKQTLTSTGAGSWLRFDTKSVAGSTYTILIEFNNSNGIATVEFAIERDLDSATAISHHVLKDVTQSCASTFNWPVTAMRLNVGEITGTSITFKVLQND